jgi:hypothetical protein
MARRKLLDSCTGPEKARIAKFAADHGAKAAQDKFNISWRQIIGLMGGRKAATNKRRGRR